MNSAFITGASSGIGRSLARLLASKGVSVTGLARNFSGEQGDLEQIEIDLSQLDELPTALKNDKRFQASFDTLVLNAGYGRFGGIEQFSFAQIKHLIDTNLVSNLFLLKHFLPRLQKEGDKDIVIVGSESAVQGGKQGAIYSASKFALRGLAQSLRYDLAASGGRVILVNPGPTNTDFFDDLHFQPKGGEQHSLSADTVAKTIVNALEQPRNTVLEEINIQPIKRAFSKR